MHPFRRPWLAVLVCCGCVSSAHRAGAPPPADAPAWTLAVLPDTQKYADRHPEIFAAQTRWIAENRNARRIRFVVHLGDVVDHNTREEWTRAKESMARLDGLVPYAIAPGNHDYGLKGKAGDRTTLMNEYFPPQAFEAAETLGGWFEPERIDNGYHLLEAGGRRWLILLLEFGPREQVVKWADRVLADHADRTAIVVTHAYLCSKGELCDQANEEQSHNPHRYGVAELPGGVHDGRELFDALISKHPSVAFVLCGHIATEQGGARHTRERPGGPPVHELLANYQGHRLGGGGMLRLMEFSAGGRTVRVRTYSPHLEQWMTDPANDFTLPGPPER